jgi:hypothetical protein
MSDSEGQLHCAAHRRGRGVERLVAKGVALAGVSVRFKCEVMNPQQKRGPKVFNFHVTVASPGYVLNAAVR